MVGLGVRSLHLLFKGSTGHNRYLSVDDCSEEGSDEDFHKEPARAPAAAAAPNPPASPIEKQRGSDPTHGGTTMTMTMRGMDGSDSLTSDDGYDGFAAGSWHSAEQPQQHHLTNVSAKAAPTSPLSVIIHEDLGAETAPSTPYLRRMRQRRRSSMPLISTGADTAELLSPKSSSHAACNWTDPARRTLWVTSPGSARAHLEFSPRSFVPYGDSGDSMFGAPRTFQTDDGIPDPPISAAAVVAASNRSRPPRRHSSFGVGGKARGIDEEEPRRHTAAAAVPPPPVSAKTASGSSLRTPASPIRNNPRSALDASRPPSRRSPSPRRRSRRAATARHISSRRRPTAAASSSPPPPPPALSMNVRHLQVPVV